MARQQISQGNAHGLHPIYLPHLLPHLPYGYGALILVAISPDVAASYAVPVRQAGTLPTASFRFPVTQDTLAVPLMVPAIRVHRGLAPPSRPIKHHA